MSIVELSFIAIGAIGVLGVVGIVAIVTGRGPGNIDWKKNLDKRAVKAEKSKEKTSFFAPRKPKSVEEANVTEVTDVEESDEAVEESDGSIKIEEKVVYEEISGRPKASLARHQADHLRGSSSTRCSRERPRTPQARLQHRPR